MKKVAEDLWLLDGFPPYTLNIYLARDVLIDAGTRFGHRRILRQLKDIAVTAHAITHAHADHQGSSHLVCEQLGIPLWCGRNEAEYVESEGLSPPGPPHPVARKLRQGNEVAGFKVIECPGHSPGHIAFFRETDRALILGDVLTHFDLKTGRPGLYEPPATYTPDPQLNRESARKLAKLEPLLVCFGHGRPLDDAQRFLEFVGSLA